MFAPLIVFDGEPEGLTPFNLVPTTCVRQSGRLIRLSAVPFSFFRFFGPEYFKNAKTYPVDFWFTGINGMPGAAFESRAIVFWATSNDAVETLQAILATNPMFVLSVSDDRDIYDAIQNYSSDFDNASAVWVGDVGDVLISPRAPSRIWKAFLESVIDTTQRLGTELPALNIGPHCHSVSPEEWLELAELGCWSRLGLHWPILRVPNDFVVSPGAIIRNHGSYQLCEFEETSGLGDEAYDLSVQMGIETLSFRGLTNLWMMVHRMSGDPQSEANLNQMIAGLSAELGDEWGEWILRSQEADIPPPGDAPPRAAARFSPPQTILLCPSFPVEVRDLARRELSELADADTNYFDIVMDAVASPGRQGMVPEPSNKTQEEIFSGLMQAARRESEFSSAFSVFYATRFQCPVLKLPRIEGELLAKFQKINATMESADAESNLLLDTESALELAGLVADLSDTLENWIPESYHEYLLWLSELHSGSAAPIIHTLTDYPLELARFDDDYLGYQTQLSRTPMTPGITSIINYSTTELTTILPTAVEDFLLVSPFEDDPILSSALKNLPRHMPEYEAQIIRRRGDLLDALDKDTCRCLVYFGHGMWDAETGRSSLVLQDQFFDAESFADVEETPPLVILIGCNTAASSTVLGGFHQELFSRGTRLIIGTSFPVPKAIGTQFLTMFMSNLLSPGVTLDNDQAYYYRDLAEIVAVTRRRIRWTTELYSLLEQQRVTADQASLLTAQFLAEIKTWSPSENADEDKQFQLLSALLVEAGILEDANATLSNLGTVPYPLFFQLLGFPWTLRTDSWS